MKFTMRFKNRFKTGHMEPGLPSKSWIRPRLRPSHQETSAFGVEKGGRTSIVTLRSCLHSYHRKRMRRLDNLLTYFSPHACRTGPSGGLTLTCRRYYTNFAVFLVYLKTTHGTCMLGPSRDVSPFTDDTHERHLNTMTRVYAWAFAKFALRIAAKYCRTILLLKGIKHAGSCLTRAWADGSKSITSYIRTLAQRILTKIIVDLNDRTISAESPHEDAHNFSFLRIIHLWHRSHNMLALWRLDSRLSSSGNRRGRLYSIHARISST